MIRLSKTVCGIFLFGFRFVFIKVYIFVQQSACNLWLNCILKTNISPESLVAKSIIKYHMMSNNFKSYTIEITEPIVQAFKSVS